MASGIMDGLDSWDDLPENIVEVLQAEGNDTCVDCNAAKPDWASLGFSVLVCLECAGKHRALGVHISPVRSIAMDSWNDESVAKLACGGNKRFREYITYLASSKGVDLHSSPAKYTAPHILYYREILNAEHERRAAVPYDEELYNQLAAQYASSSAKELKTAPQWVPDNATDVCMLCGSEFSFTNRRHHCRRCGICVCKKCAPAENARPILEWGLQSPVRHCKKCYMSPSVTWT